MDKSKEIAFGLVLGWEKIAKRRFVDAKSENDDMGKRLVEHGAVCYFNAAAETRRAFGLPELMFKKDK